MAHPVIIRVKKLATMGQIGASGSHTWRERPTPNADPARTPSNTDLRSVGSTAELRQAVQERLAMVSEKPAANPVRCIEYLVTANHDAFTGAGGQVDADAYLRDALAWIEGKHGAANVVAANIQRDERTPHLVAYVVPLVEVEAKERKRSVIVGTNDDGTKRRETRVEHQEASTRLSAAHFLDGRAKLSKLQDEFATQVGQRHGLVRGVKRSRAQHTTVKEFYAGLAAADQALPAFNAQAIEPRELEPGGLMKRAVMETPDQVAQRLTRAMHGRMQPLATAAAGTGIERKKRKEAEATAKAKTMELAAARPILEPLAGLPAADVAEVVKFAQEKRKAADVAQEIARRLAKIAQVARDAGRAFQAGYNAVTRYCLHAMAAIEGAGDAGKVDWEVADSQWITAARAGRDGNGDTAKLTASTALDVVLAHSPDAKRAALAPADREKIVAQVRANDQAARAADGPPEPEPDRRPGPGR